MFRGRFFPGSCKKINPQAKSGCKKDENIGIQREYQARRRRSLRARIHLRLGKLVILSTGAGRYH